MTAFEPRDRIIVVIRTDDAEAALAAARGVIEGGVGTVEITLTVPGATEVLERLRAAPALVGAGTVLDADRARQAVAAGARFLVAPDTNLDVLRAGRELGVPVVPGALTPTEIQSALRAGAAAVKVFPAGVLGGPSYIRELRGPLPDVPLVISGGVTAQSAREYLAAGVTAVCLGREFLQTDHLAARDIPAIAARARSVLATILGADS